MKEINKYINMQNNQLSQEYQQLLEEIKKWCAYSMILDCINHLSIALVHWKISWKFIWWLLIRCFLLDFWWFVKGCVLFCCNRWPEGSIVIVLAARRGGSQVSFYWNIFFWVLWGGIYLWVSCLFYSNSNLVFPYTSNHKVNQIAIFYSMTSWELLGGADW